MRYLGMSLGMGVALGYCAAFGTLLLPTIKVFWPDVPAEETVLQLASSTAGKVTLVGVVVCLLGICVAALAGFTKEKEMPEEQKKEVIKEFNFKKGILVATFSGIMSASLAIAFQYAKPIDDASLVAGTGKIWTGLPSLTVALFGGFTTNFIWCVLLNVKNRSGYQYLAAQVRPEHAHHGGSGGGEHDAGTLAGGAGTADLSIPVLGNYIFSAMAGTCWYFQFFFYKMGATQMGKYDFASWTLHMASIIIFSTIWGWIFKEWRGASKKAHLLIAGGIATLILSTIVIGYGTYLKGKASGQ
jgi:L-rhamnose-H+ transport protein